MTRRNKGYRMEVKVAVLEVCSHDELILTRITRKTRLCDNTGGKIVKNLVENGFLTKTPNQKNRGSYKSFRYRTTSQGEKIITAFNVLEELLNG